MIRKSILAFTLFLLIAVPLGFKSYDAHAASDKEIQELKQMIEQNHRQNEQNRRQNELLMQKIDKMEAEKAANQVQMQEFKSKKEDEPLGAEFAFTIGAQTGPFKTDTGFYMGGELGLPIYKNLGPGKLMGLINISWAKTDDNVTFQPTVNALVPGALPEQTSVDLTTVLIVLGLKYKLEAHPIIQPYILAGPGFDIFFDDSDPGNLPGGIAPQPNKLKGRGFPSGQGNVKIGLHAGGGVDFNLTKKIFVGAEARYNYVDRDNGSFGTYGGRVGFRF